MSLSKDVAALLRRPVHAFVTTLSADGSPHTTMTWVDTDGENVLINVPSWSRKLRNVRRDARVSVGVADPDQPRRYVAVHGTVTAITTEEAGDHIEELAQRYLGLSYAAIGGDPTERALIHVRVDKLHAMGWDEPAALSTTDTTTG
ncbi:TIGR03618 family F420-dependent PPOX class oxidoreductase [Amycolatopsis sp. cmx-4-68]|uniref:TIGR03618 family F420-dependent PPOX class oxidoreductase n=1 Tax=Amycolatopsis sp. cmx-4-68 TaxID=2790938 RepID=UPI00397A2A6F